MNNESTVNELDFYKRSNTTHTQVGEPESLLEGMGDYFVLSTKIKNEQIDFSPSKKNGWKVITKAIFNPQAPQHKIFKENLTNLITKNKQETTTNPISVNRSIHCSQIFNCNEKSKENFSIMIKNIPRIEDRLLVNIKHKRNQSSQKKEYRNLSFDQKMNSYQQRAYQQIYDLTALQKNLKQFTSASRMIKDIRKDQMTNITYDDMLNSDLHQSNISSNIDDKEQLSQRLLLRPSHSINKTSRNSQYRFDKIYNHTTKAFDEKKRLALEMIRAQEEKQRILSSTRTLQVQQAVAKIKRKVQRRNIAQEISSTHQMDTTSPLYPLIQLQKKIKRTSERFINKIFEGDKENTMRREL